MIHANLQREDLEIAGEALTHYHYDEEKRFALLHTKPCDPNLLGVISDMVNCVATVDCCVVYNETPIGYKMSVRSAKKNLPASDLAEKVSWRNWCWRRSHEQSGRHVDETHARHTVSGGRCKRNSHSANPRVYPVKPLTDFHERNRHQR